jgi:hypothetical protein
LAALPEALNRRANGWRRIRQDRVQRGDQGLAQYFQKSSQVIVVRIAPRPIETAMSACSRSREKVAMPHWRGGHVATNAAESVLAVAVIKSKDPFLDSVVGQWLGVLGWLRSQSRASAIRAAHRRSNCATRKDNVGNIAVTS